MYSEILGNAIIIPHSSFFLHITLISEEKSKKEKIAQDYFFKSNNYSIKWPLSGITMTKITRSKNALFRTGYLVSL